MLRPKAFRYVLINTPVSEPCSHQTTASVLEGLQIYVQVIAYPLKPRKSHTV